MVPLSFLFMQMARVWFIIINNEVRIQYYHSRRSSTDFSLLDHPHGTGLVVPFRNHSTDAAMEILAPANRMPLGPRVISGRSARG